jgi:hypothetical protein
LVHRQIVRVSRIDLHKAAGPIRGGLIFIVSVPNVVNDSALRKAQIEFGGPARVTRRLSRAA